MDSFCARACGGQGGALSTERGCLGGWVGGNLESPPESNPIPAPMNNNNNINDDDDDKFCLTKIAPSSGSTHPTASMSHKWEQVCHIPFTVSRIHPVFIIFFALDCLAGAICKQPSLAPVAREERQLVRNIFTSFSELGQRVRAWVGCYFFAVVVGVLLSPPWMLSLRDKLMKADQKGGRGDRFVQKREKKQKKKREKAIIRRRAGIFLASFTLIIQLHFLLHLSATRPCCFLQLPVQ